MVKAEEIKRLRQRFWNALMTMYIGAFLLWIILLQLSFSEFFTLIYLYIYLSFGVTALFEKLVFDGLLGLLGGDDGDGED